MADSLDQVAEVQAGDGAASDSYGLAAVAGAVAYFAAVAATVTGGERYAVDSVM